MTAGTFTIPDIGRRIHMLSAEHLALSDAKSRLNGCEVRLTDTKLDALMVEIEILRNLLIVQQPETLADAAIQTAILFYQMSWECGDDETDVRPAVDKVLRALPGIARRVSISAGIELFEFCPEDIGNLADI